MTILRSLLIPIVLPYPAFCGRDLRNWQNARCLSKISRLGVYSLYSNELAYDVIPPLNLEFWRHSRVATRMPAPNQIIQARAWPFDPMGHPADVHYLENVSDEIAEILATFKPHLVVIEGLSLYRYIDIVRQSNSRIVLDCHNVEAMLYQEIGDNSYGDHLPARLIRNLLPVRTKLIERNAVTSVDQIWVCSDADANSIKHLYGASTPIQVVPNGVDVSGYYPAVFSRSRRSEGSENPGKTLIFPAWFRWEPNAVAVSFLLNELWPRLAGSFPGCRMLLAGRDPTPEMITASRHDSRIVVTGGVPDIRPYLAAATAMVVPLFQGGGTRLKILEAFAAGVPVISTAKGAEGLAVEDGKHLLLAETVDAFIGALQRLWSDQQLAAQLAASGLELVREFYSFRAVHHQIVNAVHELISDMIPLE
jgi:glycosyltransferase involved in cell wall biosynthesis